MQEKELKNVPGLEPEDVVVIKKLGFGSLNELRSKSTNASINRNGGFNADVDLGKYMKWLVVYGVKSAPFFPGNLTANDKAVVIDKDLVPSETGEFLYKEIQKLNGFEQAEELKKK
jgi:hypothetical protein